MVDRPAGMEHRTGGVHGEEGYVHRLFDPLPGFGGYRPALGAASVPPRIPEPDPQEASMLAVAPGFFPMIGRGIGAILLYAVLGTLLMLLGFYAIDRTTPGRLTALVRSGRPNAVIVTAAGTVSMAFIVVVAIHRSGGVLLEGLLGALIFGIVGILAQVGGVRLLEWVTAIDIGAALRAETVRAETWVVAAAHVALGLIVGVSII